MHNNTIITLGSEWVPSTIQTISLLIIASNSAIAGLKCRSVPFSTTSNRNTCTNKFNTKWYICWQFHVCSFACTTPDFKVPIRNSYYFVHILHITKQNLHIDRRISYHCIHLHNRYLPNRIKQHTLAIWYSMCETIVIFFTSYNWKNSTKSFREFQTASRICMAIKLQAQLKKCSTSTALWWGLVGTR